MNRDESQSFNDVQFTPRIAAIDASDSIEDVLLPASTLQKYEGEQIG